MLKTLCALAALVAASMLLVPTTSLAHPLAGSQIAAAA
jgi:hypothetical protein